ncbi:MAG: hypothetical protein GC151_04270 [Betaproteobacteria bacterium]|nr:hypothetical protein [Betaproteobacteria bacterium]
MKRIALALSLAIAAGTAMADGQGAPEVKIHTQSGLEYVTGGIGDQMHEMQRLAPRYPIHLVFNIDGKHAQSGGVRLRVFDVMGHVQLEADTEGPVFYIGAPSGRYTFEATWHGQTIKETRDLTGRRYLVLDFDFKS